LSDDSHHQGWWLSKVDLVFGASLIWLLFVNGLLFFP
jgi:hypothetical protein